MTFSPDVPVVDITCDFNLRANADMLSMGYLSRICYAWVSPTLTVSAIRLLEGNPNFSPVSMVSGCGVAGIGLWFNILLLISVVLLAVSRKNLVTWLCVVIFVSSNFAPLKMIGYERYFPQIWAIFPLAVMNFVGAGAGAVAGSWKKTLRKVVTIGLVVILAGLDGMFLSRFGRDFGMAMVFEGVRQRLISSLPKVVKVDDSYLRYTTVQRFRHAGITMIKAFDGEADTTVEEKAYGRFCWYLMENMPRRDPKSSRLVLPTQSEQRRLQGIKNAKQSALTCTDPYTGERVAFFSDMVFDSARSGQTKAFFSKRRLRYMIIDYFPHVLWDNGQGGAK